jgi:hypothetical protein
MILVQFGKLDGQRVLGEADCIIAFLGVEGVDFGHVIPLWRA